MQKLFHKFFAFVAAGLVIGTAFVGCSSNGGASSAAPSSTASEAGSETSAPATDYPTKPIQLLCIHKAGASTDIIARTLQPYLSQQLGQQVVVQNITGGGGLQAMSQVNKADPDGYTLLISPFPSAVIKQVINDNVDFDLEKFTFVSGVSAKDNNVLAVAADSPIKTIDDFKNTPNLKVSGSGVGTNGQLAAALLKDKGHVNLTYVPFEGGPEAINAVLGKQVDATVADIVGVIPLVTQGKMRIVGTFGSQRDSRYPDVPTFVESNMPGVAFDTEVGIAGPPNMSQDIVKVIQDAVHKVISDPTVQSSAEKAGFSAVETDSETLRTDAIKQFELVTSEKSILAGTGK